MKKFNIRLFLKVSFLPVLLFIGAFLLCSCVADTHAANAGDEASVERTLPLSESIEESETVTDTSSLSSSSSSSSPESSSEEPATVTTVKPVTTDSLTARSTESFATTSKQVSTARPSTTKAPASSSSSTAVTSSGSTKPGISGRIDSLLSKLNGETQPTETAVPVEVTLPPSTQSSKLDFSGCAFLGNSRVLSIKNYGFCKDVYGKVSLNVQTVFTEKNEGSKVPVIDELNGKKFKYIFIMFGDNETGWGSMDVFKKDYIKVINAVRDRVPGATIYLVSVLPISKAKSDENEYDYNKSTIDACNKIIKTIASEQGLTYVNAASAITNSKGYLPDEASTDGCHLGKDYTRKWLEYCADYI